MISIIAVIGITAGVVAGIVVGVALERRAWTSRIRRRQRRVEEALPRLCIFASAQAERFFAIAPATLVGEVLRAAAALERVRGRRDALAALGGTDSSPPAPLRSGGGSKGGAGRCAATPKPAEHEERSDEGRRCGGESGHVTSRVQREFERHGRMITTRVGGGTR